VPGRTGGVLLGRTGGGFPDGRTGAAVGAGWPAGAGGRAAGAGAGAGVVFAGGGGGGVAVLFLLFCAYEAPEHSNSRAATRAIVNHSVQVRFEISTVFMSILHLTLGP